MNRDKNDALQEDVVESGKKKGRRASRDGASSQKRQRLVFILIDVLLIAAIVAAVLFVVSLLTPFSGSRKADTEKRDITYTLMFDHVNSDSVDAFQRGAVITDATTGAVIGVVTDVDVSHCEEYRTDVIATQQDATLGTYVVPKITYTDEYMRVVLTVTVTADYEIGVGYTADGCRIAVEREYDLHLPAYAGRAVCLELSA